MRIIKLCFILFFTSCKTALAAQNDILGEWARDKFYCDRPELIFDVNSATIQIDGDGEAVIFNYPKIAYSYQSESVLVILGKKHPYAKTRSHEELDFFIRNGNEIEMSLIKNKTSSFIRCK